jgi:hypothetical protein
VQHVDLTLAESESFGMISQFFDQDEDQQFLYQGISLPQKIFQWFRW